MPEPAAFGCKVPSCEYPRGGACYEGLKPEDCPNRGPLAQVVAVEPVPITLPPKAVPAEDDITFGSGFPLLLREVRVITEQHDAGLIVILGEKDAGKTTLLAELHHQFLNAPFAGFLFAGSRTIVGFEEKCFYSRVESDGDDDDTERTKHMDVRVLHLSLRDSVRRQPPIHLLFADVSGERFRQIRASREEAEEIAPLLKRADRIVLLVDGERLADIKTRQMATTQPKTLLRGLLEAGSLSTQSVLDVVFAKWDAVLAAGAEAIATALENAMHHDFAARLGDMTFHRVSSRRKHDVPIAEGMGLDTLLQGWATKRRSAPLPSSRPDLLSERAFFRFGNVKEHVDE